MTIVETEDTLGGEPRLEGRRISVMQVAEMYIDGGMSPENVADQLGVGLDEIHEALAYYYKHPDDMDEIRRRHRELEKELKEKAESPERAERYTDIVADEHVPSTVINALRSKGYDVIHALEG